MVDLSKGTRFWIRGNGKLYSFVGSVVTPPAPPTPQVVIARVTKVSQKDLTATFSSSSSTTSAGTIDTRVWDFGDNGGGTSTIVGANATHTWATPGIKTVSLTVTNSLGVSNSTTATVTVVAPVVPNVAPKADIQPLSQSGLTITADGSGSADADGTIVDYAWSFGDGGASSGPAYNATHTYATQGVKTVTLVVTDDKGAKSAPATRNFTVNTPPTAAFTATANGASVAVDGTASVDRDGGTIVNYFWSWGDSTPDSSGAKTSHTYAASGTYTVTLTVADNLNAANVASKSVQVAVAVGYTPFTIEQTEPTARNTGVGLIRAMPTRIIDVSSGTGSIPEGTYTGGVLKLTSALKDAIVRGARIVAGEQLVENVQMICTVAPGADSRLISTTSGGRVRFCTITSVISTLNAASGLGGLGIWEYNNVTGTIDGLTPVGAGLLIARGNYVNDLQFNIDPAKSTQPPAGTSYSGPHKDERWAHNDGMQANATTTDVQLLGNSINGRWSNSVGALPVPTMVLQLSALMFNNVKTMLARGNWVDGGDFTVNAQPGSGTWTLQNNRYRRGGRSGAIIISNSTKFRVTIINETYLDTGAPVSVFTNPA